LTDFSPVPLTLEGSFLLHQFFRFDWKAWRACTDGERESCADGERKSCADGERRRIAAEAVAALQRLERGNPETDGPKEANQAAPVQTALFSQLGHKGDLILIHFRDSLEALNQVELDLAQTRLYDFLDLRHSYVSVVEVSF